MSTVRLVAGRELREAFRSRGYWITVALVLVAVAVGIVVPRLFGGDGGGSATLGVAGRAPVGLDADLHEVADAVGLRLDLQRLATPEAASRAVREEDVDAALVFEADGVSLVRREGDADTAVAVAAQGVAAAGARQQLLSAGLSADEAEEVLAVPPPREVAVDAEGADRGGVAYAVSLALYLAILVGGMAVATGVAVEKSTHVAEVLVTVVRPAELLAGKVLGIGITTCLQLLAGAVPLAAAILAGWVDVPRAAAVDVLGGVGWFVLGYAVYAVVFAVLGALVDRQEELSGAVAPMSSILVLSFFAGIQALESPSSTLARITSLVPFSAPMVMPVRIARGAVGPAEVAAAVAIGIATFLLLARLGGVVYRRALLRGGRRLKLLEVLRA